MRGDTHVRFGRRARETDSGQPGHRARARPNRIHTAEIMPGLWCAPITAGQRHVQHSGTPHAASDIERMATSRCTSPRPPGVAIPTW
jgi:hypothetical protein